MSDKRPFVIQLVRATRHHPPNLAAHDEDRARRYVAGLEQFEQLLEAARVVGPASRPIPLFYAVEQAGYSIAAAHLEANEGRLKNAHGLGFEVGGDWASATVKPQGKGSFRNVCAAVNSPPLTADVPLAALWASLPEASGDPQRDDKYPTALSVSPLDYRSSMVFLRMTSKAEAWVGPLPEVFGDATDKVEFLQELLAQYPNAVGWESTLETGVCIERDEKDHWYAKLHWKLPDSTGSAHERVEYLLARVAPRYDKLGYGWLRPALSTGEPPPTVFMTWWALLYGLSMLARYYPDRWMAMLDIDSSPIAASLETIVDDALEAIPKLVLGALTGRDYLEP